MLDFILLSGVSFHMFCRSISTVLVTGVGLSTLALVGVYAEGFDMNYTVDGQEYTTRSETVFAVCASQGPNPEPIAETCERMEKW